MSNNDHKPMIHFNPHAALSSRDRKVTNILLKFILLTFGAFLIAIALKIFVNAGGLVPGGISGVTVLIQRVCLRYLGISLPFTPIQMTLNLFPIYIGLKYLGRNFTLYSIYVLFISSVFTDLLPAMPVTDDMLLISVFGALISAAGSSLILLQDATTGGTDFIASYFSVKRGMDAWNMILAFNVILLSVSGLLFGWEKALYSILYQYVGTQVIHTLFRRYQHQTLFVVTNMPIEVSEAIYACCHHGATVLSGIGAYEKTERNVLYSIVSRGEVRLVINEILKVDPSALINTIRTEQIRGNFYQRPMD